MSPDEITAHLAAAGRILLALPTVAAITPEMCAGWPEMVSRAADAFGGDVPETVKASLTPAMAARNQMKPAMIPRPTRVSRARE